MPPPKKIIKFIDNIKTNDLFNVAFIIFNYSFNMISKSWPTLNHKVLGHLGSFLLDGNLDVIDVGLGDLVGDLLQKSHTV